MAATVNLSIDQGTDFARVFTIKDDQTIPVAIDLTGYTFSGQARAGYGKADISFTFTFEVRDQVAHTGKVDMTLLPEDTSSISLNQAKEYVYDVEMVSPAGTVTRLFQGICTLNPEVTK